MSSQHFLKYLMVTLFGTFIGFYGMSWLAPQSQHKLELASTEGFLPEQRLAKIGADQFSRNYFDVKFDKIQIPESDSEPVRITAKLTALKDLPSGLSFNWNLSPGVKSQMSTSGIIPQISAKEEHSIEIEVTGFSKASRGFASLSIGGSLGSHRVGRNIITTSRPEESYEHVLHQSALHRNNEKQGFFIQTKLNGKSRENKFDPKNIVR